MSKHPQISFLGGAGTVTGSKFLVYTDQYKILIDCGLFQGIKEHRELNWKTLPIEPSSLDAIILTHAHLDHTGYLPVVTRDGFKGPIYCSAPTLELTKLILQDSARIQMEDASFANESGTTKHSPALPLYNLDDANHLFPQLKSVATDQWQTVIPGHVEMRLSNSGHILGSTFVELKMNDGKTIVFSGDLGRKKPLLLHPHSFIRDADTLVIESTYGDRMHTIQDPKEVLHTIINRAYKNGGTVLIPSFAIGRAQELIYLLHQLREEKKIPQTMKLYLDSPMANRATHIFDRFPAWHTLKNEEIGTLASTYIHVSTPEESIKLRAHHEPCIIIAGSGMLNGGRIRHHLVTRISDPKNEVILVGFQASGTPGRFLRENAGELKLFGKYLPIKAQISEISALSAHADQHEIVEWIKGFKKLPEKIFLVHGEPQGSEGLRVKLTDTFHKKIVIPRMGDHDPCF